MTKDRIASWEDLKVYVAADLASIGKPLSFKSWIMDPTLRLTVVMRLLEYLTNTRKTALLRLPVLIWFRRLQVKLGFSIGPNIFGPGVAIVHHGLLIIDPTTRIGRNCRIHQGVHIGGAAVFVDPARAAEYSPRIGDNVYIGPGAKIYGPIRIGSNCTIGANAVVTEDFDGDGLLIAGVPAKVLATSETGERAQRGAGQDGA
ncbi:serine O-acetyltransferase [Ancylobacter sp. TS-1]|uniref:serine O-acetyltransferase n=1 Tax=Ancylobacter sp. TS-1 TaxID=1850374 RepID=UPI001265ACF6|nr:DapH/DapD/GlmU-related protein [Ancylobacter sp. TS-1]QFR33432.1 serine acetyltransferase [Ancylobacter sp. TS-1]